MKSLITAVAVGAAACTGLGQGQFCCGNRVTSCGTDARVFSLGGVTPPAQSAYPAPAYFGLMADSLVPTGLSVLFRTGRAAGYIATTLVTRRFPGGTAILVEMRVWEAAGGASYEAALAAEKLAGKSNPVLLAITEPPNQPPYMVGLQAWGAWSWPPPVPWPPGILHQLSGRRVASGSKLSQDMEPTGSEALRFQRHRDAQVLAGETYYLFRSSQARWADAGDSYVTGGNARGVVTSRVARVVVGYPLTRVTNGPGRIRVEPPFEIVEPRQQGELIAVATAGAVFEGWNGDPLGSTNTTTLTVGGDQGRPGVVFTGALASGNLQATGEGAARVDAARDPAIQRHARPDDVAGLGRGGRQSVRRRTGKRAALLSPAAAAAWAVRRPGFRPPQRTPPAKARDCQPRYAAPRSSP